LKARAASFQGSGERLTRNEADLVAKALVALEWMMRPAGPEFLMMQLERLSAWATSFNIAHDPRSMPAAYADLAKVPARLLERAVSSAMSATTDTYRLPLPGKLLALIAADLDERKLLRTRLLAMRQTRLASANGLSTRRQWHVGSARIGCRGAAQSSRTTSRTRRPTGTLGRPGNGRRRPPIRLARPVGRSPRSGKRSPRRRK